MNIRNAVLLGIACFGLAAFPSHAGDIDTFVCQSGNQISVRESPTDLAVFAKTASSTPAAPGECVSKDQPLFEGGDATVVVSRQIARSEEIAVAVRRGGTFTFQGTALVRGGITVISVAAVNDVRLVEGQDAGDLADGEDDQAPGGGVATSADCPAGVATVTTSQVGEDVLNVRAKPSRDAEIVAQVPDGSQVSVTGACFTGGAGFAKGKTLKPKVDGGKAKPDQNAQASAGWCRIDEPAQGCVKAEFLAFGQAPKTKGAGLAKAKTLKPQDGGGKPQPDEGLSFAGDWSVTADDDVTYSMSMTQKGTSVSGSYRGGDGSKGTFKGKVKGNVLRFTWKQSDGYSGSGKFALADDGSSFDGSYNFGKNSDDVEGSWNGSRN